MCTMPLDFLGNLAFATVPHPQITTVFSVNKTKLLEFSREDAAQPQANLNGMIIRQASVPP